MSATHSIGFIGAGKMATALAIGFLKSGLTTSVFTVLFPELG